MGAEPRKVLLVLHQEMSDPGRIGQVLSCLGYELDARRPMCGDALPETMDEHAGAVVFGGPMSANDEHLPGIRAELDWIPTVLAEGKPYLGLCLGAQMLSRVLGGKVGPHPDGMFEIGFYDIAPTTEGETLIDTPTKFYQWHSEGFSVPDCCKLLAVGPHFENQAFRYDGNAFGFQFHPEVTTDMMHRWTRRAVHRLSLPGAQCRRSQLAHAPTYEVVARRFLERFLPMWLGLDKAQRAAAG